MTDQALLALKEANVCLFVVDANIGIHPLDLLISQWLRKNGMLNERKNNHRINGTKFYLVVNKAESWTRGKIAAQEFWELGFDDVVAVSGIHGDGVGDLLDSMFANGDLPVVTSMPNQNITNVAILGRPNVGKSSLFNRFVV